MKVSLLLTFSDLLFQRKYTPLHVAASLGKEDIVKMILSQTTTGINTKAKLGVRQTLN